MALNEKARRFNRFILILFHSRHTMHNTFDFVSCNVYSSQMISVVASTMVVIVTSFVSFFFSFSELYIHSTYMLVEFVHFQTGGSSPTARVANGSLSSLRRVCPINTIFTNGLVYRKQINNLSPRYTLNLNRRIRHRRSALRSYD